MLATSFSQFDPSRTFTASAIGRDLRPEVLSQNRLLRSRNSVKTATGPAPAMPKFAWILGLSARRNGLVAKARAKRLREAGAAALRKHLDAQPRENIAGSDRAGRYRSHRGFYAGEGW